MYSGTRKLARQLGIAGPVGCIDGSYIADCKSHLALASVSLPGECLGAVLQTVGRRDLKTYVFANDCLHYDDAGRDYASFMSAWSTELVRVESVLDLARWDGRACVHGLACLGPRSAVELAVEGVRACGGALVQVFGFPLPHDPELRTWGMIVRGARATKATAMEWIAAHHGLALEQTVAIGDWLNDIPMLKAAGRSFAMAQAEDVVKAAASDVLEADDIRGGALYEAARRAGLL